MSKAPETFWDRLVLRCMEKWPDRYPTKASVTQTKAGKLIGLSQNTGFKWQHGTLPEPKHLVALAVKLDVAREWLETGRGPKFCAPPEDLVTAELFRVITSLDEPQRMELLRYAQYIKTGDARALG